MFRKANLPSGDVVATSGVEASPTAGTSSTRAFESGSPLLAFETIPSIDPKDVWNNNSAAISNAVDAIIGSPSTECFACCPLQNATAGHGLRTAGAIPDPAKASPQHRPMR